MKLENKTALVTGGNSGLGLEITKKLLEKGASVIVLSKDRDKLQNLEISLNNKNLSTIQCDLSKSADITESLKSIDSIDLLVNSAGVIHYGNLEEEDTSVIERMINTNLLGTILVTKHLLPIFKKQNSGTIINVSSTSGLMTGGHPRQSVYMASKYGVSGFTEGLKKELAEAKTKVRVLGFYPGGMNTEIFAKSGDIEKDVSGYMDPSEVAEIVMFMIERSDKIKMDHIVVNRNK